MPDGVTTNLLDEVPLIDAVLGNREGSTAVIPVSKLIGQILANMGPTYATKAELDLDLSWTAKSVAVVYGDPIALYNGLYQKSGLLGTGYWTRISDHGLSNAVQAAVVAQVASEAALANAMAQATASAISAADAQNARSQAELMVQAAGSVQYTSVADGRAGSVDGQVFQVIHVIDDD